jgi:hypothetical protein
VIRAHGYNRRVKIFALAAAAALLAGCSRDIQNTDAVRAGVVDYLKARTGETGLDVNTMLVEVGAVSFQRDEAHATVLFRPKSAPDAGSMQMSYTLDRKGSKWVVRGKGEAAGNPHAGDGGRGLPPGHPAPNGQAPSGQLPQGHPPVSSQQ